MLGLAVSVAKGGASLLTYVKDNLKLYLDFKSSRSDTLAFPSEGSTSFTNTTGEHIDCGTQIATDLGGSFNTAFTVSFWLYRTVTNNSCGMFYIGTFANANGKIQIYTSNDTLKFRINNVDQLDIDNFSANNVGWNYITLTWNASTTTSTVYVNGVAQTPKTNSESSIAFTSSMKTIIGNYYGETFPLNGKMANVGLWSRALSLEEVNSVMNKSYSQLGSVEKTSLVSWWALDSQSDGLVQPHDGETLGANLFTDSTFNLSGTQSASTTGTYWTTGNSWTIANGEAIYDGINNESPLSLPSSTFQSAGLYKFTFTISNASSHARIKIKADANDIIASASYSNGDHTIYYNQANAYGSAKTLKIEGRNDASGSSFKLQSASWELVTSNTGVVTGATTTTSVYGGNAPVLPRAIDIAESFAEQIGDGSALFDGATDLIQVNASSNINNLFKGGGTLTAWIRPDGIGETAGRIANKGFYSYLHIASGSTCKLGIEFPFSTTTGAWTTTNHDINFNEWQHIAITYNGSSTSNNASIYVNGISVAVTEATTPSGSISDDTADLYIGNRSATDRSFDGEMAHFALWQGVLSQAQIQSVMESTSYAKIPADVKSTLGSEVASGSDWSTVSGITVSNGNLLFNINNSGDFPSITDSTAISGKFYKTVFTISNYVSGGARIRIGSSSFGTERTANGTYTEYITSSGTTLQFYAYASGSNNYTIENISVKEVTNDLVAYYPLDADSSRGNGTDNVVTGETLGDNLATVTTFANQSAYGQVNIIPSSVADGNGLYKISYTVDSYTSGNFQYQSNSGTQPTPALGYTRGTSTGDKVDYIFINNAGTHFQFRAFNLGYTGSISNIQIRKVTSNTGVLL